MANGDDRWKAMTFSHPEYIPVGAYFLPAAWMEYREQLDALVGRHPVLFGPDQPANRDYDALWSPTYGVGEHVDVWGCVWSNCRTGMEAIVTTHPVPRREDVRTLKAPAKDTGNLPHGFMFLRLTDLRGFEEAMVDFAEEPPELQQLIDLVLEYNLRQLAIMLAKQTEPGIIYFGDDLGTQHALPMSPAKWRKYLKPCYAAIYSRVHAAGHKVYMHTDGHIHEIIPDLVECGVDVINPQIRANGLDNLVRVCKGKVCVDLDLDRQLFPFCTPAEADAHVRECVVQLGSPAGGLWLKAELAQDVPLATIEAVCQALEKYRGFFRAQAQ